jgi:hypothetical protein
MNPGVAMAWERPLTRPQARGSRHPRAAPTRRPREGARKRSRWAATAVHRRLPKPAAHAGGDHAAIAAPNAETGLPMKRLMGFEPTTFCMARGTAETPKRASIPVLKRKTAIPRGRGTRQMTCVCRRFRRFGHKFAVCAQSPLARPGPTSSSIPREAQQACHERDAALPGQPGGC